MELVERGHTGWTDYNRSVDLLCLYLFEFQINTNIRIIQIIDIQMRALVRSEAGMNKLYVQKRKYVSK